MTTILTLSDLSLSKLSETPKSGVFMVSDHELNVVAARATLSATGVKPIPKGSMISIGDDELPKVREWLHSIMETGRQDDAPQEVAEEFLGVTKKVDRSRPRKGMSRSENRAGIADALKAKETVEAKPVEKAAEKPAKAKNPEKAAKAEPAEEKPAEKTAEASAVPAEFTGHSRAYATGRKVALGEINRPISHEWVRGIVAFEAGQDCPGKDAGKWLVEGWKAAKKGLNSTDKAWLAGYRSA